MTKSMKKLWRRLILDAEDIGLPISDVDLCMRPYSKCYYGNYFPRQEGSKRRPRVYVYPYRDRNGCMYSYDLIMDTLIHEMVHHVQYTSPDFVRLKGVMHNPEFWEIYNRYLFKAKLLGVISDEYKSEAA